MTSFYVYRDIIERSRIKYTYNEISVKNTADRRAVSKLRLPDSMGKNEVFNGQKYTKGKKAYSFYRNRRIRYVSAGADTSFSGLLSHRIR